MSENNIRTSDDHVSNRDAFYQVLSGLFELVFVVKTFVS